MWIVWAFCAWGWMGSTPQVCFSTTIISHWSGNKASCQKPQSECVLQLRINQTCHSIGKDQTCPADLNSVQYGSTAFGQRGQNQVQINSLAAASLCREGGKSWVLVVLHSQMCARVWLCKARLELPKCSRFAVVEGSFLHFLTTCEKRSYQYVTLCCTAAVPYCEGFCGAQQWTFWIWVHPCWRRAVVRLQ